LKTFLSVSLEGKSIIIVEGGFEKGLLSVNKAQSFKLPVGCIKNDDIADELLFADALQNAVKEGGFASKSVIMTMNNKRAFIKELQFPVSKPKEIEGMIKSELFQSANVPKSEMIQYKIIDSFSNEKGEKFNSYRAATLDRDLVESYYNAIEHAKLRPVAMDIELNSIDKLSSWTKTINGKEISGNAVVLIDFNYLSSTVYIVSKGLPLFYRILDFGTEEVWRLSGEGYGDDPVDAEKLSLFDGRDVLEEYKNGLKPYFYKFNDEIQKTIIFFNNQAKSVNVSSAYIFGPGSRISEMAEFWSENLNIPVEVISSVGGSNAAANSLDPIYINAAGSLIRYQ
jgi:type IV pilus assembly protein PilM